MGESNTFISAFATVLVSAIDNYVVIRMNSSERGEMTPVAMTKLNPQQEYSLCWEPNPQHPVLESFRPSSRRNSRVDIRKRGKVMSMRT